MRECTRLMQDDWESKANDVRLKLGDNGKWSRDQYTAEVGFFAGWPKGHAVGWEDGVKAQREAMKSVRKKIFVGSLLAGFMTGAGISLLVTRLLS